MRFYNRQHRDYCGIDLHVKTMYIGILDRAGQVLVHRNLKSTPEAWRETIAPSQVRASVRRHEARHGRRDDGDRAAEMGVL